MARPPVFPAEEKVRIVRSVLAGGTTVAEAARRARCSSSRSGTGSASSLRPARLAWPRGHGHASTLPYRAAAGEYRRAVRWRYPCSARNSRSRAS
jgi:transposase-like protein